MDPHHPSTLLSLPPELLLHISTSLPYPDLLALKHSHPLFYSLTTITVYDRVDWLLSRPKQGLTLPQTKCILKTDREFCANREVREMMRRRRGHLDCRMRGKGMGEGGCLLVQGDSCKGNRRQWRKGPWMWTEGIAKSQRGGMLVLGALLASVLALLIKRSS
jgi:hypothetical protein